MRPRPIAHEIEQAAAALRESREPLIVVRRRRALRRSDAMRCARSRNAHGIPVAETQAGKSALPWDHPLNVGGIGVTGSSSANELAQ